MCVDVDVDVNRFVGFFVPPLDYLMHEDTPSEESGPVHSSVGRLPLLAEKAGSLEGRWAFPKKGCCRSFLAGVWRLALGPAEGREQGARGEGFWSVWKLKCESEK